MTAWNALGGIEVLVCNAGVDTLTGAAGKWSFDENLDALLTVDLKAAIRLSRDLGARMKRAVAVRSLPWGGIRPRRPGRRSGQLFAAVKGAVMCFTRSLALDLARRCG